MGAPPGSGEGCRRPGPPPDPEAAAPGSPSDCVRTDPSPPPRARGSPPDARPCLPAAPRNFFRRSNGPQSSPPAKVPGARSSVTRQWYNSAAPRRDESYDEVSYSSSLSHYVYHPPPRPLRPRRVPSPFVLPSPLASLRDDPHREFRRRLRAFRPGVSTLVRVLRRRRRAAPRIHPSRT